VCCTPYRATKTLMVYLMETNPTVYSWLVNYYKQNPIPKVSNRHNKGQVRLALAGPEAGCCAQLPDQPDRLTARNVFVSAERELGRRQRRDLPAAAAGHARRSSKAGAGEQRAAFSPAAGRE
jgi:hypothetical protein